MSSARRRLRATRLPHVLLGPVLAGAACGHTSGDAGGSTFLPQRDAAVHDAAQADAKADAAPSAADASLHDSNAVGGDAAQSPPGDAQCTADLREPDDTTNDAQAHDPINGIVPRTLEALSACPGDTDLVWAGRVDPGGKAGATLSWDRSLGALELSLLDAEGKPLPKLDRSEQRAGQAEGQIDEYFGYHFFVRVHNPGAVSIPYALIVTAQVFGP